MNCKPGDLAMVLPFDGDGSNAGRIVRVLEERPGPWPLGPAWWIEPPLEKLPYRDPNSCYDAYLRPIRDSDGEDEMLRIAGLPQKETA